MTTTEERVKRKVAERLAYFSPPVQWATWKEKVATALEIVEEWGYEKTLFYAEKTGILAKINATG